MPLGSPTSAVPPSVVSTFVKNDTQDLPTGASDHV